MKTAKILSLVVVIVALVGLLTVTGWMVRAQDDQPLVGDPVAVQVKDLIEQGKQIEASGDYVSAMAIFQKANEMAPKNWTAIRHIGFCLQMQNNFAEALGKYQQAVSLSKGADGPAWYGCAVCYRELGDEDKVRETVQKLKEISPISEWTIRAAGVQMEMEGRPEAEVQIYVTHELEAADLYRQARDLARETGYKSPDPLSLFDRVSDGYPETGAARSAMSQKAEVLWHLGKREDMCKVYDKLRAVLKQQPYCEKVRLSFRTMDCRIGQHRAEQLLTQIGRELAAGRPVEDQYWDRFNVYLERWRHNADGGSRAESDSFRILAIGLREQFSEGVPAADAFINEYFGIDPDRVMDEMYKDALVDVQVNAAIALRCLNRPQEAHDRLQAVLELAYQSPPLRKEKNILPVAYAQLCWAMKEMGAPQTDINTLIDEFASLYPNSSFFKIVKHLRSAE